MAVAGKSDAELLEMIYNVKSPSQKPDNHEEVPDNFKSERNELPVSDIRVETNTHEDVPISDSMQETNSIKQESFSVNSFESLVTLPETSQNEINSSVETKMDSVPMELASEYSGNDKTVSSALPTLADSDTNQIIYSEKPNFAVTDDCFSLSTLEEMNQISDHMNSKPENLAVKEEIDSTKKVSSTLQHNATTNDELYHLNKEELVENLISCRKELDSLRKQLSRSERQLTKSDDYNELLREKVEALSSQIHSYKKGTYTEAGIQVDQNDLINYTIGEPCMPDWGVDTAQGNTDPLLSACSGTDTNEIKMPEDSGMSIANSIKMAAQEVVNKQEQNELLLQGYVYDETYGLYYHPQTGYYYDSEKMLYYEPHSGTYYYYDYDTGQYAFHSQVNVQDSQYAYNQTTTQHKKETNKPTEKAAVQKKKKTIESKRRKGGVKVEEQVFKNRQERRKAMREEKEKELKRKEEKRKQKEKDRRKRKSSKKKKKKKSNEEDMDSDGNDSKHDRKNRKSSKKHKKHKKKNKKEKKSKEGANEDIEKQESNGITKKIRNGDKADISDTIADAIEVSDEELPVVESDEEGELNENECMDVDQHVDHDVDQHANEDREVENTTDKTTSKSYNEMEIVHSELNDKGLEDKGRTITKLDSYISDSKEESTENAKQKNPETSEFKELDRIDGENLKERRDYESITEDSESSFSSESESGEISDSSTDQSAESTDSEDDVYVVSDNENNEIEEETTEDIVQSWRPCVRVIVTESDCLAVGMLYIITYQGMSIGRGKENGICVPDINVSKFHADVKYDENDRNYTIIDKGSQNGTFINSERISLPKEVSAPRAFKHGDVIQVADTKLLCHIHSGMDTCDDCEPGIVMARYRESHPKQEVKFVSKDERKKMQRQELNEIKKRYGLKNAAYEDPSIQIKNLNYEDKAAERRKTVGSDTPHVKHETPASVHRPISAENKGHKMLAKMGWKEGESLGKNNSGIQEPISVSFRINQSAGLGSGVAGAFSVDDVNTVDVKKASRRMQALQRYTAIEKADGDSAGIEKAKGNNKATEGVSGDNVASDKNIEKVAGSDNDTSSAVNVQSDNKFKMAWTKGATEFT